MVFHKTWNPWVKDEEGRLKHTSNTTFFKPLKYKKPIRILVGTEVDFFESNIPHQWRKEAVEIMMKKPALTFLIPSIEPDATCMLPNTWIGLKINKLTNIDDLIKSVEYLPFVNRWLYIEDIVNIKDISMLFSCNSTVHYGENGFQPAYPCDTCTGDGVLNRFMIQWIVISNSKRNSLKISDVRDIYHYSDILKIPFYYKQAIINNKLIREPFLDGKQFREIPRNLKNIEKFQKRNK